VQQQVFDQWRRHKEATIDRLAMKEVETKIRWLRAAHYAGGCSMT